MWDLYKDIEKMTKDLKSYDCIAGYSKNNDYGFTVRLKFAKNVLKLLDKGYNVSEVVVKVSDKGLERVSDVSGLLNRKNSIAGYSKVESSVFSRVREMGYKTILLKFEIVEIRGNLRLYINKIEANCYY